VTYTRESGDTGCNKGESPGGTAAANRQGAAPAVKRPILEYYGRTSHGMAWPILEYYGRTSHGILWPILEYYGRTSHGMAWPILEYHGRTSHGMACSLASDPNQRQERQKDSDRSKRLGQVEKTRTETRKGPGAQSTQGRWGSKGTCEKKVVKACRSGQTCRNWSIRADLVKYAETGRFMQIWSNMQKSVKCKKMGKERKPAGQASWSNQLVKSAGQTSRLNQLVKPAGQISWSNLQRFGHCAFTGLAP
jgi:hypothetical protein